MATSVSAVEQQPFFERIRKGFDSNFWVANSLELFERLAFYGSKAVLSFYLANKIGLGPEQGASLAGLFSGVIYLLPAVTGVFVDRYGFRKMLALCFALFAIGYALIGLAAMPAGQAMVDAMGKVPYVISVLMLTAVGGSLIKPCIVGTVEVTSKPDYRALGFSIYYSLVNFGGAIGPVLASFIRGDFGIEYVFLLSSVTSAVMMICTILFFREPVPHDGVKPEARSFGKVLTDLGKVLTNFRFISFLMLFSGFYVMFWQIFYSFPFYVDEILKYKHFEILESVDAWTIIIFSVLMTAATKKLGAMPCMMLGFTIASLSWLVLAAWPTIAGSIAAIAFFAVGESIAAPRLYDYVGSLAPKDQVATYMGFSFLPVAVGSFIAGPLGGKLVTLYLRETVTPSRIWLILTAIGLGTTALMYIHYKVLGESKKGD